MKKRRSKAGFNLLELSIVLAIIGIVMGAIYMTASGIYDTLKTDKLVSQVNETVKNFRNAWVTKTGNGLLWDSTVLPLNIMPESVYFDSSRGIFVNAFNGRIGFQHTGDPATFLLIVNGVPQRACIRLLTKDYGTPDALKRMGMNGALVVTGFSAPDMTNGISIQEAAASCQSGNNEIWFMFKTRKPTGS